MFEQMVEFFTKGGAWMYPILAFQVVTFAIAIERFGFLFGRRRPGGIQAARQFEKSIKLGKLDEVISQTNGAGENALIQSLRSGVTAAKDNGGKEEIQGKMDEVLLQEVSVLENRTGYLAVFANVATLTGLLGTIAGMITAFSATTNADPVEKAIMLSSGISEAMYTTAYGLVVAVPALLAYAVLTNRANALKEDLHQGALKIYNWLAFAVDNMVIAPKQAVVRQSVSGETRTTDHGVSTSV